MPPRVPRCTCCTGNPSCSPLGSGEEVYLWFVLTLRVSSLESWNKPGGLFLTPHFGQALDLDLSFWQNWNPSWSRSALLLGQKLSQFLRCLPFTFYHLLNDIEILKNILLQHCNPPPPMGKLGWIDTLSRPHITRMEVSTLELRTMPLSMAAHVNRG